MAAGDLKGTLTANAASITNPFSATGSVSVVVGDLVFAVLAQQTALTVTAAADNLGNTYTAVNAGTDPGISTSRAFYSRVTVAGTLTSVDFTTTASANNVAAAAAVIEGPVLVSPIDANPANNNNTDNTTPFNCPATGTLAQAVEIVCCWMSWTGNSATFSATSPNLKALQSNSSTLIAAIIGYQAVNSTSTVTPVFTGTNPTDSVQGTASFKVDTTVPPDTTHQIRTPFYSYRIVLDWYRDWTQNFVISQVAPVSLPAGEQITDRPLGQRARIQPYNLGTWTWQYNLNLIGQDKFPPGGDQEIGMDVPISRAYDLSLRSWFGRRPPAIAQQPFSQQDWQTPRFPEYRAQLRTWTWNYNLNLIGKDRLPSGEISTALPARGHEYPISLRTWVAQFPQPIFKPVSVTTWGRPDDQPPLLQTWVWNYNLNLIGKDKLPVGETIFALPAPRDYPVQLRQWFSKAPPAVVAVGVPFSQADWPTPRYPEYRAQLRTWTWNYNLSLIGKDRLPVRQQDWPNPQGYEYSISLRGWTQPPSKAAPADTTNVPARILDWGTPPEAGRLQPEWIFPRNLALTTAPAKPFAQYDWPVSYGPRQPERTVTVSYNLNLIGKDRLPTGEATTALPPQPALSAIQLRTWINSVNLALITGAVVKPFAQYDWPLNIGPRQPAQTFTGSYNQNLIGKDKLPVGEIITDLPPQPAQVANALRTWLNINTPDALVARFKPATILDWGVPPEAQRPVNLSTWIQSVNLALLAPTAAKPFAQTDWPVPRGPQQPAQSFTASFNKNLIGKDKLPFRQQDWPLPRQFARQPDLGTWIDRAKAYLQIPFRQTDWPVPKGPQQPALSWTASYNKNLIGKDKLPVGDNITALPPQPALSAIQLRTWIQIVNLALITPARPFAQTDWPNQLGSRSTYPISLRTFFPPVSPGTIPQPPPPAAFIEQAFDFLQQFGGTSVVQSFGGIALLQAFQGNPATSESTGSIEIDDASGNTDLDAAN